MVYVFWAKEQLLYDGIEKSNKKKEGGIEKKVISLSS